MLQRIEEEIAKLHSDLPDTLKLKEAELSGEQRRLANFVDFIGEGRGSQALAKALVETERRVDQLGEEVEALRRSREEIFRPPPIEWIKERRNDIQQVLEQRTARSCRPSGTFSARSASSWSDPTSAGPPSARVTTLDAPPS